MNKKSKIYVAGHTGMIGSALCETLASRGYENIVTRTHGDLDLRDSAAVNTFFAKERPEYVILAAARVGGIKANMEYPAHFIFDNLAIQSSVLRASFDAGIKKLLFFGSSCMYPRLAEQPIKEEALLSGLLEPTNTPYAVAKIAGLELCRAFNAQYGTQYVTAVPSGAYGPRDHFDTDGAHVLSSLISKFSKAAESGVGEVEVWGTGLPTREFIYVDDVADAVIFLLEHDHPPDLVNFGTGVETSIGDLAGMVAKYTGYEGKIIFDTSRPDGMPRKVLDSSRIHSLGWQAKAPLAEGLQKTIDWYNENRKRNETH